MNFTKKLNLEINTWSLWWSPQPLLQKLAPFGIGAAYLAVLSFFQVLRSDHFYITGFVTLLWLLGPRLKPVFRFLLPLILMLVIYDSQRIYSDYIRGPIHVKEPYLFDKYFFGIITPEGRLTPNEYWQLHTHAFLDFICGFFYLTFVAIHLGLCAFFCFWLPFKGTKLRTREWFKSENNRPMWAFLWVNLIGYSTYYWYAAAPPWYVALHGLGPADLSVGPNSAGAARFDQLLGTHFFSEMYGRSADVFGAIPSLHVAYPLQTVYYAFRYGSGKAFSIFFYLIMCFSAVYLNHHYILDIIWGSAYALMVCFGLDFFQKRKNTAT